MSDREADGPRSAARCRDGLRNRYAARMGRIDPERPIYFRVRRSGGDAPTPATLGDLHSRLPPCGVRHLQKIAVLVRRRDRAGPRSTSQPVPASLTSCTSRASGATRWNSSTGCRPLWRRRSPQPGVFARSVSRTRRPPRGHAAIRGGGAGGGDGGDGRRLLILRLRPRRETPESVLHHHRQDLSERRLEPEGLFHPAPVEAMVI